MSKKTLSLKAGETTTRKPGVDPQASTSRGKTAAAIAADDGNGASTPPQKEGSAPRKIAARAPQPSGTQVLTLEKLDAMPAPAVAHSRLSDMSPEQLGLAVQGLDKARSQYESLSGACATLAGLVLIEAKKRCGHGEYLPWLKSNLGKSAKTASQYVAVAKVFNKFNPRVKFEQLTLALMDGVQAMGGESLDMTHPMVGAVAKWTKGRTFYELRNEFCGHRGGKQEKDEEAAKLTHDEEREVFLAACREDFAAAFERLDRLNLNHHWQAPTISDAELDAAVGAAERFIAEARRWLKTPVQKRSPLEQEQAEESEAGE